jgi:CRP-like cAMP-binding protein
MSAADLIGFLASGLVILAFYMKTMIPLRVLGICANVAFLTYGYLGSLYPVLMLHLVLLPLNSLRLYEMMQLTRQVREAAHGNLDLDWIKPFSSTKRMNVGTVLFRKGDIAADMYVVVSGRFRLAETGLELGPTQVVGEHAFLSPNCRRTQTVECVEAGILLEIGYGQLEQLFFQNPKFGFYFLKLIGSRLFQNVERLEGELMRCRKAISA